MMRRILERLPFGTTVQERREKSTESFFSFNEGGHIKIPQIGEKITVPALADNSLNVVLEFSTTYVTLHLEFPNSSQNHPTWGRYNSFGESGDPLEREMRHTVLVVDKSGNRVDKSLPPNAPDDAKYVGRIPQTDMHFEYTKTAGGQKVMRLYGPNKLWSLRWNDIHMNDGTSADENSQTQTHGTQEGQLHQLPLPLSLR